MTFDNKRGWLPDDFEPKSTILLVEEDRWSKKQTQLMEDYMKKKYPYKYEFASYEAIHSKEDKYADTKLYKYALVIFENSASQTQPTGMVVNAPAGYDFNFYNRDLDKDYPSTRKASGSAILTFEPVINTIVKKYK
jgi:hypothetical protein